MVKRASKRSVRVKGKQPKRTPNYGKPSIKGMRTTRPPKELCAKICSAVDPFCAAACGSRRFDTSSVKSVPYSVRALSSITTDANGLAAIEFRPTLASYVREASAWYNNAGINEVLTWSTPSDVPEYTPLTTDFGQFRVVSMGVRVYCTAALASSQGYVTIATSREVIGSYSPNTLSYPNVASLPLVGLEATVVSKPTGSDSTEWKPINSTDVTNEFIYIAVSGAAASTSVAAVEVYFNVEMLPYAGFASRLAEAPPAAHRRIVDASDRVATKVPSIMNGPVETRSKSFMDYAAEAVSWAVDHPAEIVGALGMLGI